MTVSANRNPIPTTAQVGGKAAALFELREAGFPVPELFACSGNIEEIFERLGPPIAIRSSATLEDGAYESFAGQFESVLNLRTLDDVRAAITRCQRSIKSEAVTAYCNRNGIDTDRLRMKVFAQRYIEPELAGVAFSVNPMTGADEVVIEAVDGVADGLLLGRQAPLPKNHPLLEKYRCMIEALVRGVELHFGCPQDVEFAISRGEVFLLQARPITRITFTSEIGEWTNADFRDGGVSSGVCTPLMWSLYDFAFQGSLPKFLRDVKLLRGDFRATAMFFSRPYWNLAAVKSCLSRLPGFVEREFDEDLNVDVGYKGDGITTPTNFLSILRAAPAALAVRRVFKEQAEFVLQFLNGRFDALENAFEYPPNKDKEVTQQFGDLIEQAFIVTESRYFRTIYCVSVASLLFKESFPSVDYSALVSSLPPLSHMDPMLFMREMVRRGETDLNQFLQKYRHHSRRELDIRVPRWDEDQQFVGKIFDSITDVKLDRKVDSKYQDAREQALANLTKKRRRAFIYKLDRLRQFLWMREEMRDCSCRMYYLLRRYVLRIASNRGLGDDVFFMTWRQILTDDRSEVQAQRTQYDRYRNYKPPNEIGSTASTARESFDSELVGIGASAGERTGKARIVHSIEQALDVEAGVILICPFTDPGWTPILGRVSAVVTETGGLLSHAAVVCREYGIPAVLGVRGATRRIPDGIDVHVDGTRGRIRVVK